MEVSSTLKTVFAIWLICLFLIMFITGFSWYTFWGGAVLAVIPTLIIMWILLKLTGVTDIVDMGNRGEKKK